MAIELVPVKAKMMQIQDVDEHTYTPETSEKVMMHILSQFWKFQLIFRRSMVVTLSASTLPFAFQRYVFILALCL